ncbi:unnamed protein product, partial [Strongylus vulgaris]
FLAFIKRDRNHIGNVFLRSLPYGSIRQVTFETKTDVLGYGFTAVPEMIYYVQDNNGDENHMLFAKNVSQKAVKTNRLGRSTISDRRGVKAKILGNNYVDPRLLIGITDENSSMYNVYSYNLLTNTLSLVMRNKRFPEVYVDNNLNIRIAYEEQKDGTAIYYRIKRLRGPREILTSDRKHWEELLHLSAEDSLSNA